ncbi:MAG: AAA family ATPase, partial [Deltaproteobacteria bacterium]|nr:AAA family ATPase [Deltaproteobacteria bacterium]
MIARKINLPPPGKETFFLWGPRQTGKSTLLKSVYSNAYWIDLLKAEEFRRYLNHPELLRQELPQEGTLPFVVIDEVQKLPLLLDEVHWLHENRSIHFALCGSSARKVKRGHANLLGGRAIRYEMFGLIAAELFPDFDLKRMLNHGFLPRIYLAKQPRRLLNA